MSACFPLQAFIVTIIVSTSSAWHVNPDCLDRVSVNWLLASRHDRCYAFITDARLTYKEAANSCSYYDGGTLAMPKSSEVTSLLAGVLRYNLTTSNKYWIGLTDSKEEGVYEWADETRMTESNFRSGEGDRGVKAIIQKYQDCVAMDYSGHWYDLSCGRNVLTAFPVLKNYICEFKASS